MYHWDDPGFEAHVGNVSRFFKTAQPLLRKWVKIPDNYDQIYKQALLEMQQEIFEAKWKMVTAWGTAPM